jgi:pimeloyl-ACP methyl ester carboxylesterase
MKRNFLYRWLKAPFFGKYRKPWIFPQMEKMQDWEKLTIASGSNARLAALFGPALARPATGNVLLAHPMGADAKGFFLKDGHARFLRENGFNVLLFDFNGFGESQEGNFRYMEDVLAAGRELSRLAPGLPAAVVGTSFGGSWALCALSMPGHGFSAAVIEGAFTTLKEFWRRYPLANLVLTALTVLLPKLEQSLRPIAQVRSIQRLRKILFVYSEGDRAAPFEMGERLFRECNLPHSDRFLWKMPQARHTQGFTSASPACRQRYADFLRESLTTVA